MIDNWKKETYKRQLVDFTFEKDKEYEIRVEFFEPIGNAHLKLVWDQDTRAPENWQNKIQEAVSLVQKSDVAIIVAGITEGEFQDRAYLNLPGHQEELIQRISETGKPVVVVLVGGSAITMKSWLDNVDGVLDVWYPGEEGGNAVAEVLFGDYNPAGRLPITFPVAEAQLPLVYRHLPTGRGDDYNNLSGLPLFPFGFGLSYTSFEYTNLRLDQRKISKSDSVLLRCTIRNMGDHDGEEVVQLYIRDLLASVARPVMELKAFQRILIPRGEAREIIFKVTPDMLSMLDEKLVTKVEPGDFRIMVGSSSRDIRLKETLVIE